VTRITTPLDQFIADLLTWIDSAWFVWIAMALSIVLVIVTVTISKARARARARVPQYRRQGQS
jgi:heme exporter protein D